MKKTMITLILSLLLALNTAACGTQPTAGNDAGQSTPDSSGQNTPDDADSSGLNTPNGTNSPGTNGSIESGTGNSGINMPNGSGSSNSDISSILGIDDSSLSISSVTDFYNSQYRTLLEDALNEVFTPLGLRIFITAREPDTLVYNYQYISPLSSIGLSHEDAAAAIASNFQEATASAQLDEVVDSIKAFQSCGLPVKIIRMTYLDADGSLVYSTDITEDGISSGPSDNPDTTPGVYADLQAWMDSSEDVSLTVESTNQALASTGITFDLTVDGSILIYQYYLPDSYFADGLTEEDLTAAFDSMVDAGSASVDAIISMFMEKYGLNVNAVRFVYYSKDGTELYSRDVTATP